MMKPKQKKKRHQQAQDIPKGARDFLGPDNLHLFRREDIGVVAPQGRVRPGSEKKTESN
jgi:hypothetical protein